MVFPQVLERVYLNGVKSGDYPSIDGYNVVISFHKSLSETLNIVDFMEMCMMLNYVLCINLFKKLEIL